MTRYTLWILGPLAIAACSTDTDSGIAESPAFVARCGDGACTGPVESCQSCPADCRTDTVFACVESHVVQVDACGEPMQIVEICGPCGCMQGACLPSCCGDGACNTAADLAETCESCPTDCGDVDAPSVCLGPEIYTVDACGRPTSRMVSCGACGCLDGQCVSNCCGDGVCDAKRDPAEDCESCPGDCVASPAGNLCTEEGLVTVDHCGSPLGPPKDCGHCGCSASGTTCKAHCCGDGTCDVNVPGTTKETCETCPQDCAPDVAYPVCLGNAAVLVDGCGSVVRVVGECGYCGCEEARCIPACCGDGICNEDCAECPKECSPCCGDALCDGPEQGEDCHACPGDCPQCCGDGTCDAFETCQSCASDCGVCCPNGTCESFESCASCASDCGECCGNGTCDSFESCASCASDCGACCPNGSCESSFEDACTCPADCPGAACCGDGVCDVGKGEHCGSCAKDCGCAGFSACVNGICECPFPTSNPYFFCNSCYYPREVYIGCKNCSCKAYTVPGEGSLVVPNNAPHWVASTGDGLFGCVYLDCVPAPGADLSCHVVVTELDCFGGMKFPSADCSDSYWDWVQSLVPPGYVPPDGGSLIPADCK